MKLAKISSIGKFLQGNCITRANCCTNSIKIRLGREIRRPGKNPVTKPHKCADMLTSGVEMSKKIWIRQCSDIEKAFFASHICRFRNKNPAQAPTIPIMHPEAPTSSAGRTKPKAVRPTTPMEEPNPEAK